MARPFMKIRVGQSCSPEEKNGPRACLRGILSCHESSKFPTSELEHDQLQGLVSVDISETNLYPCT